MWKQRDGLKSYMVDKKTVLIRVSAEAARDSERLFLNITRIPNSWGWGGGGSGVNQETRVSDQKPILNG